MQFFLNQSDELEVGPSDLPGPLPGNADNGWNPMDATQRMESPKNDTTNVFFCFYSKKMNENTHVFRENIFLNHSVVRTVHFHGTDILKLIFLMKHCHNIAANNFSIALIIL